MVSEVPSYDEFFGLVNDKLTYSDWVEDKEEDEDIALIINAVLVILQEFYMEHQFDTEAEWVKESLKQEFNGLNKELYDTIMELLDDFIEKQQEKYDSEYGIPANVVDTEIYFGDVMNSGVDSVVNQLYDEIRNKADFYNSMVIVAGNFTIEANFRRAVKKLSNIIKNNAHHGEKVIERKYLEFVYGEDALFDWIPSGRNTCEWCYMIADMSPLPLYMLPVDHINGACTIKPHYPERYSSDYLDLMGGLY